VVLEMKSGTQRFSPRDHASVNQNFDSTAVGDTANPDNSNFISARGMGWFPGYAINLETGERLNIAFGENSDLPQQNGADMIWNPTSTVKDTGANDVLGGMHYVWIFGHNLNGLNDVPKYDYGAQIISKLSGNPIASVKRAIFKDMMWTAIPIARYGINFNDGHPKGDVKVRLRVAKTYRTYVPDSTNIVNGGNPLYEFSVPSTLEPSINQESAAKNALNLIRVVPNPYYAYSSYERTREDQLDNRVRITNLPGKCTISIYTLNGTLVRQIKRDVSGDVSAGEAVTEGQDNNLSSTLDWDLKNSKGIPIASGMYLIHVKADGVGERTLKWFGVIRPIDLDTF